MEVARVFVVGRVPLAYRIRRRCAAESTESRNLGILATDRVVKRQIRYIL
jgi:hypothetical protein